MNFVEVAVDAEQIVVNIAVDLETRGAGLFCIQQGETLEIGNPVFVGFMWSPIALPSSILQSTKPAFAIHSFFVDSAVANIGKTERD